MTSATYKVSNQTRQTTVAHSVEMADNFMTRFKGLMGRPGLPEGHGLWITPCADIHSCFMRFEFDAVFVDKENKVVHCIEKMKPWGCSPWIKGAKAVLELDGGVIAQTQTQVGDQLVLEPL